LGLSRNLQYDTERSRDWVFLAVNDQTKLVSARSDELHIFTGHTVYSKSDIVGADETNSTA
jgi:hypothetical protein